MSEGISTQHWILNYDPPLYSRPTLGLRFQNGRLQQQFELGNEFSAHGVLLVTRREWRDVPSVDPDPHPHKGT